MIEVRRVLEANFCVYGVRKVGRPLDRDGIVVARGTVARLMQVMRLKGVVQGKTVRATISDPAAACPFDRGNRQFKVPRPNALQVSDFTYGATWSGFVCVAFVIDAYARRIVGWRVSRTAHAAFVLDALEPSPARTSSPSGRWARATSRQGLSIPRPALHRAACRGRRRAPGLKRWRQLR